MCARRFGSTQLRARVGDIYRDDDRLTLNPEGIQPVATEERPIEFNTQTQRYEQKEYWILQAMHSGEFLFSDLMVTLDGLADIKPIKNGPIRLSVTGSAKTEDSATPEAWPQYLEDQNTYISLVLGRRHDPDLLRFLSIDTEQKKGELMQKTSSSRTP